MTRRGSENMDSVLTELTDSQVEQKVLSELEARGLAKYRELCSVINARDAIVARVLGSLETQGKVHRRMAWWKLGPAPVEVTSVEEPKVRKKYAKRPATTAAQPESQPQVSKLLAYLLLDLLVPDMDAEDEEAIIKVIKYVRKQHGLSKTDSVGRVFPNARS